MSTNGGALHPGSQNLSVYSTPVKGGDRDRHPFPLSANPSPASSTRQTTSSSVSGSFPSLPSSATAPSSSIQISPQTLNPEALLQQHGSASDPKMAALEQAVNDRNILSAQNSQLWKLIEKQRAGYNQILKELERIRGERDGYKSKLAAVAGLPNGSSSGERRQKTTSERGSRPSLDLPSATSSPASAHPSSHSRGPLPRHNSDDTASTPRTGQHHQLHSSRSFEPMSGRIPDHHIHSGQIGHGTAAGDIPPPPPSSAPPSASMRQSRPSPSPLVVPSQSDDYSTSSAVSNSPDSAFSKQSGLSEPNIATNKAISNGIHTSASSTSSRPLVYPRKSSIAESVSSVMTTGSGVSISTTPSSLTSSAVGQPPSAPYTQSSYHSHSAPQSSQSNSQIYNTSPLSEYRQHSLPTPIVVSPPGPPQSGGLITPTNTAASIQVQQQQRMLSPVPENRPHALSRESRISLPDEARQYIANMADSPATSPHAETFSPKSKLGNSIWPPPVSTTPSDSGQESEFLDMGDEDSDDESEIEGTGDVTAGAKDPVFDSLRLHAQAPQVQTMSYHERDHATYHPPQPPYLNSYSSSTNSSREDIDSVSGRRQEKSRVGAEEFPLPPPSHQFAQRGHPQDPQHLGQPNFSQQSLSMLGSSTSSLASGSSPSKQPQPDSYQSEPRPSASQQQLQSDSPSQSPPAQPAPAAFRALPLLSSDLPQTSVTVSHSFVRPNDRGKEVLSFIVFVNPGNGKDGWKVEKMYSDVLGLDQRVRSSVGKGVIKKIGNLPEGKLWKDHAPAKVDQRKAVLENYLQTLIRLPVKNNDEVVAFFTSDIVREEKAPVMQAGHKEGYLTKRGKNFGGWKTRFFVLQGPVLEYYDCRGGAHLGSIQITGAQIARQHRTEKAPNNDDEKEYRHAFLIVEAKKGPGGNHPRHVLCAESDEDRDSWVEMLVRYYTGTYSDELVFNPSSGMTSVQNSSGTSLPQQAGQPRSSTSTEVTASSPAGPRTKAATRGAMPIPQLSADGSNTKLFQTVPTQDDYARSSSPARSLEPSPAGDKQATAIPIAGSSDPQKRAADRSGGGGLGLPSSLPDSSPLSAAASVFQADLPSSGLRANSELGHYPDLQDNRAANRNHRQTSMDQHRPTRDDGRKSFHPTLAPSTQNPPERVPSPEKLENKVKISGPMNGAPIPHGLKFGGKDAPPADSPTTANDRREKAKSRSFWGFGKGDKQPHAPFIPRVVFGVPLEEALEISQICHLPSIIFRSIQYLETKKADQEEGIYRLSGSSAVIKSLKDMFNNEGDVDLLASDEYWDPHAIAGLLKSFLRELPSSILTRELHFRFLAVIDFVDPQERIRELSQLIAALPLANYSLLRALTAHLILVVQNSNVNKMTMRNVGIVFSPTLGIPAGVFSLMLGEFNRVFNVETDGEAMASREVSDHASDPLRRNSRQYSDAAADQLLGLTGRTLTTSAEETQSDGDDFSLQDDSGPETTEGEMTVESTSSSPAGIRIHAPDSPSTPVAKQTTKASHMAATKGLNVSITPSDRGNRHSRIVGLPQSPRPQHSPARPDANANAAPPLPPA
ncbi:hypothetical protein CPB83DRAFT_863513 [Crepidotus variabilis]|uniref:RhoGAP-domain-containing protein n=1 Tax=Crepidotus variabilis TaxID=179855 RepID=A0A9P6JJ91_9AGAR|nr:hypothetical protein CPB83DRAFT_863513 [Crepidotus variabilis]